METVVCPRTLPKPEVAAFFHQQTSAFSYVIKDPDSDACAIIDSVLDFDYPSGSVSYGGVDKIVAFIRERNLRTQWLIETHVHADHLSAAPYLKANLGGKVAIGEQISLVQQTFAKVFNEGDGFQRDGSQFDHLFSDGESYHIGTLEARAMHTPGHTPACMTHVMGDVACLGDTLFMPDCGTARADFPGGDASQLYQSIQRVLQLPDDTRLLMCHDYPPESREVEYETTVAQQRQHNIHVGKGVDERSFVAMREARDKTLGVPGLILPSIQVNMRAGHFPNPEGNQVSYLKIPIKELK